MEDYTVRSAVANAWTEWTAVHSPLILRKLEALEVSADAGLLPESIPLDVLAAQRALVISFSGGGAMAPTAATSKEEGRLIVELYARAVSFIAGFVRMATATAVKVDPAEEWESTYDALIEEWKAVRRAAKSAAVQS